MSNTNSVTLHRVLKTSPEKLYRAFTNPVAFAAWLPPFGFTATVHEMNAETGGTFRMSFHNFTTGNGHSFSGSYQQLVPGELVQYTTRFDDPNLPGEMTTTVQLKTSMAGTSISITQEGIPAAIPVDFCYLGWQESLAKLAQLAEPNIPDA